MLVTASLPNCYSFMERGQRGKSELKLPGIFLFSSSNCHEKDIVGREAAALSNEVDCRETKIIIVLHYNVYAMMLHQYMMLVLSGSIFQ